MMTLPFALATPTNPLGLHSDAVNWSSRVTAAGDTVSNANLLKASDFLKTLDSTGLRSKVKEIYVFGLTGGLAGALQKLVVASGGTASLTNVGFTAANYSSAGLTGTGTAYLTSGYTWSQGLVGHLAVKMTQATSGSLQQFCGFGVNSVQGVNMFRWGALTVGYLGSNSTDARVSSGAVGNYILSSLSSTNLKLYQNGAEVGSSTTTRTGATGKELWVFDWNADTSYRSRDRLAYVAFGESGLTPTEATAYNTAIDTLFA